MNKTNSREFKTKIVALRRKFQSQKGNKPKIITIPYPRYDEVFWKGMDWLNGL